MNAVMLTVRLPPEARARLRAICGVTGLPLQDVVVSAFAKFYRTLPPAIRREVEQIQNARKRYGNGARSRRP